MKVTPNALKTFKRWYTVVVMVIILALLVAAYLNWGSYSNKLSIMLCCFAVLAGLMLVVTGSIIKQMIPKEKQNKFRNK